MDVEERIKHTKTHGQTMYVLALEHAINMFKIGGEDALVLLETRLAKEKKELKELEQL